MSEKTLPTKFPIDLGKSINTTPPTRLSTKTAKMSVLSFDAKDIVRLHASIARATYNFPAGANKPPINPENAKPAQRKIRSLLESENTIPVATPAIAPPDTEPYLADSKTISTASIRPIEISPIASDENDNSKIHPVIAIQAISCGLSENKLFFDENIVLVLLIKYAPAAASVASIRQ